MLNSKIDPKHVVAYLADWSSWELSKMNVHKLTRLNYAFALVKDNKVHGEMLNKIDCIKHFKKVNPNLETLISIGGWGADGFSDAALTKETRQDFADTALEFLIKHSFDGIDVDWEYPCRDYAKIKARAEDRANFTLLMKALRDNLNKLEDETGQHHPLTIAAGAAKQFAEDMELEKLVPLLDTINLMTYDFRTVEANPGHHTNLFCSENATKSSADSAVKIFVESGVPVEKLILGAAFYGRGWSELDPSKSPFKQNGLSGKSFTYSRIKKELLMNPNYKRVWDEVAKAPYLTNGTDFVTYDDTQSLRNKVAYVKENELAGIMFWEWSEDSDDELLDTIVNAL